MEDIHIHLEGGAAPADEKNARRLAEIIVQKIKEKGPNGSPILV